MARDLTHQQLHIMRCTIDGQRATVYSCDRTEATTFARRLQARIHTRTLPSSWQAHVSINDRSRPSASTDHAAPARRTHARRNLLPFHSR